MTRSLVLAAALALSACGTAAVETGSLVVTAISTAVTADHDCHQDGGCKALKLPP